MTIDASELRGEIAALEAQVTRLRRIVDDAEAESATEVKMRTIGLDLPADVVPIRPAEIISYLGEHPDMAETVDAMIHDLANEFRGEHFEILLSTEEDENLDARYLVLNVRLSAYDDSLLNRLDAVSTRFDDRFSSLSGWAVITTDHVSVS